ncbi:hypothetical protein ACU8KH_05481 [Lachancea thermotolerans]
MNIWPNKPQYMSLSRAAPTILRIIRKEADIKITITPQFGKELEIKAVPTIAKILLEFISSPVASDCGDLVEFFIAPEALKTALQNDCAFKFTVDSGNVPPPPPPQ